MASFFIITFGLMIVALGFVYFGVFDLGLSVLIVLLVFLMVSCRLGYLSFGGLL